MISMTYRTRMNLQPSIPALVKTPSLEEKVTINPQPLPPKVADGFAANWAALQTQPLVLKNANGSVASSGFPSDWVTLNPQPLPPKDAKGNVASSAFPSDWVTLNPQPLPPKVAFGQSYASIPTSEMNKGIIIIGGRTAIR